MMINGTFHAKIRYLHLVFNRRGGQPQEVEIDGRNILIHPNTNLYVEKDKVSIQIYNRGGGNYYSPPNCRYECRHCVIFSDGSTQFLDEESRDVLEPLLSVFNTGKIFQVTKQLGMKTANCIFCDRELFDPRSVKNWAGPTCRQRYGAIFESSEERAKKTAITNMPNLERQFQQQQLIEVSLSGEHSSIRMPKTVIDASPLFERDDDDEIFGISVDDMKKQVIMQTGREAWGFLENVLQYGNIAIKDINNISLVARCIQIADILQIDEVVSKLSAHLCCNVLPFPLQKDDKALLFSEAQRVCAITRRAIHAALCQNDTPSCAEDEPKKKKKKKKTDEEVAGPVLKKKKIYDGSSESWSL
jgi:hypothetical protein